MCITDLREIGTFGLAGKFLIVLLAGSERIKCVPIKPLLELTFHPIKFFSKNINLKFLL